MNSRWIMISLFAIVSMAAPPNPAIAQKLDITVDGHHIVQTIAYMSSESFLGRKPGTPEFHRLQDWVTQQYAQWGLEPGGDKGAFFQTVPISQNYAVTYGTPQLIIDGREFFARYEDFAIDPRSTAGRIVEKKVVFAGYGISAPDKGLDEYAGIDVRGKIVLVLSGSPDAFKPPRPRLGMMFQETPPAATTETDQWTAESTDSCKMMTAYQKGAAAILFFNPETETTPFRRSRNAAIVSPFQRDFVVINRLNEKVMQWILWTDPQMSASGFTTWFNAVRADIKQKKPRSFETARKARIREFNRVLAKGPAVKDSLDRNIIACITGSDPALKNEYVIVGAHFDHLGVTNGQIYNGAEDNASGSAVVMEVARLLKASGFKPKRTMIFCLWTGEELGLLGSRYWAKNPTMNVTLDRVAAYINLDMVGVGQQLDAPGGLNFPSIWEVITRDQDPEVLKLINPRTGGPGGSDHSAFIEQGIEALALMTSDEGGHPDYHDTGDDWQKMNPEILRTTARFVLQGMANLASETQTPLLIANRQDLYDALNWPIAILNPEIKTRGAWSRLAIGNSKELADAMIEKTKELRQPQTTPDPFRAMRRRFGAGGRSVGLAGPAAFDNDVELLRAAKDLLEFGRIEIRGDDGVWFEKGVTEAGLAALAAMRKENMLLQLIDPDPATLRAVLEKTRKPFLITGHFQWDDSLASRINDRDALIGIDFDPLKVDDCFQRIITWKTRLGDSNNLILYVTSDQGLEDGKKELYAKLLAAGWTKKEIYAIGGAAVGGGGFRRGGGGGNLEVLPGGPPPMPQF